MAQECPSFSTTDPERADRLGVLNATAHPLVTPSLLNCDFARVGEEINALERAGVVALHLDVMDGHFVPNLSYGPPVIQDWRKHTTLPFDAHLMMTDPGRHLDAFVKAGCDVITVHIEVEPDPRALLAAIRSFGCQAGLSLNPPTPVERIEPFLDVVDVVLVMSVMPGFGGQVFDPSVLPKVNRLRALRPQLRIAVDGGINPVTAADAVAAGATQLVAGSSVFRHVDHYAAALAELAEGARRGFSRGGASAPPADPASGA